MYSYWRYDCSKYLHYFKKNSLVSAKNIFLIDAEKNGQTLKQSIY